MNSPQTPTLPDLPPQVFAALQTVERGLAETAMTRARHIEAEQALNLLAQYCMQAHQTSKAPVLQPPAVNGTGEVKDAEPRPLKSRPRETSPPLER